MLAYMFSKYGSEQSYKIECKPTTTSFDYYRALVTDALTRGDTFIDFFNNLKLSDYCRALNNAWFNPVKLRSRISKQYCEPQMLAALLHCTLPEAALIQLIYAKSGLTSWADDYAVWMSAAKPVAPGTMLTPEQLCAAISYGEFYRAVFHDALSHLVVDCANAVKASQAGTFIGSQAPQAVVTRVAAFELQLRTAATGGALGRSFDPGILLVAAKRAFAYAMPTTIGEKASEKKYEATDAYALVKEDIQKILGVANFYAWTDATKIKNLKLQTALPGAITRLSYGLDALTELKLLEVQEVRDACADIQPVVVHKIGSEDQMRPFHLANYSGLRNTIEPLATTFGIKIMATPDVDSKLFASVVAEEKALDDLLCGIETAESQLANMIPLRNIDYCAAITSALSNVPEVLKISFIASIGQVVLHDDSIVYVLPYKADAYTTMQGLAITVSSGLAYTTLLDDAFAYAVLVAGGLTPDTAYRSPFGQANMNEVLDVALVNRCREKNYQVINVGGFSYVMRTPGARNGRVINEPDFMLPFGLFRRKYGYLFDSRMSHWASTFLFYFSQLVNTQEMYDSADQYLIQYAVGYAKRAKAYFGDQVRKHYDNFYGPQKATDTPNEVMQRARAIVVGTLEAYRRALQAIYPATESVSTQCVRLAQAAAVRNHIDLLGRML